MQIMTKYEEKLIKNATIIESKNKLTKTFKNRKRCILENTRKVEMITTQHIEH
jgi:hypothetical protein